MKFRLVLITLLAPLWLSAVTLQECVDLATKNNKPLQESQEQIEKTKQKYNEVKGMLLPQVTLSGGFTLKRTYIPKSSRQAIPSISSLINQREDLSTSDGDTGLLWENDSLAAAVADQVFGGMVPDETTDQGSLFSQIQLTQIIFKKGELINGLKVLSKVKTIREKEYFLKKQQVVFDTKKMFYQALLADKVFHLQKEALQIAREHLTQATSMYHNGLISEYDRLRAEMEVARLVPDSIAAENNYKLVIESLRQQIGWGNDVLTPEGDITLTMTGLPSLDSAMEEGLESRREIALSDTYVEIMEVQLATEKDNWMPELYFQADITQFTNADEFGIEGDDFGTSWQVGLAFQMPLFTGFSNTAKYRQARQDLKMQQLQHADLRDKIRLDVRNSWQEVQRTTRQVTAQQKNLELADKGLGIAEARWQSKVGIQLDVLDAQLMNRSAKLGHLNAVYEAIMAWESLKLALGREL